MREAPQPASAPSTNYDDCYKSSGSDTYIEHCYHAIPRKLGFGMEKDHVDCIPDRDAAHHIFARVGHCGYLDLSDEMICQFIDVRVARTRYEKLYPLGTAYDIYYDLCCSMRRTAVLLPRLSSR